MSQRAYMLAARDHLRTLLSLGAESCEVMFDGQPSPLVGEMFVAVHPGEWRGASDDADLDEYIGFRVTVTRRLGFSPMDRWGPEVWAKMTAGMEAVCRKIIIGVVGSPGLHMNQAVRIAANAYIGALSGFIEPARFMDGGNPEQKGPDWFSAVEPTEGRVANAGVAQTLTFGRARRLQELPPQDVS